MVGSAEQIGATARGGGERLKGCHAIALAIKSGVKIAYGTDLGQGDHTQEFGLLIGSVMSCWRASSPVDAMPPEGITLTRSAPRCLCSRTHSRA